MGAAGVFSTFGFGRKSMLGHIFRAESEALAERPAEEGLEGQESRGTRRVEDLNIQVIRSYSWAAAKSPKKLVV